MIFGSEMTQQFSRFLLPSSLHFVPWWYTSTRPCLFSRWIGEEWAYKTKCCILGSAVLKIWISCKPFRWKLGLFSRWNIFAGRVDRKFRLAGSPFDEIFSLVFIQGGWAVSGIPIRNLSVYHWTYVISSNVIIQSKCFLGRFQQVRNVLMHFFWEMNELSEKLFRIKNIILSFFEECSSLCEVSREIFQCTDTRPNTNVVLMFSVIWDLTILPNLRNKNSLHLRDNLNWTPRYWIWVIDFVEKCWIVISLKEIPMYIKTNIIRVLMFRSKL